MGRGIYHRVHRPWVDRRDRGRLNWGQPDPSHGSQTPSHDVRRLRSQGDRGASRPRGGDARRARRRRAHRGHQAQRSGEPRGALRALQAAGLRAGASHRRRQDAEELAQEVFLRVFRGLAKFRGDAQLSTWMYRLAVNAALSHARARRRAAATQARARPRGRPDDRALPAAEPAPTATPSLRARLERALARLPAGYRAVLVLHDVEGLQHEEIAGSSAAASARRSRSCTRRAASCARFWPPTASPPPSWKNG